MIHGNAIKIESWICMSITPSLHMRDVTTIQDNIILYFEQFSGHFNAKYIRLVPTVLHLSAAKSEEFCFCFLKK
jgi:hypothetical protein